MQNTEIINKIKKAGVVVVGDIMLDRFIYGSAERISPEGPVPVLKVGKETEMLGGAGNVLSNLAGLGAGCTIVAVTGRDENGQRVRAIIQNTGYDDSALVEDAGRPTTVKTRFIAQNQQLLRTDSEDTAEISKDIQNVLMKAIEKALPKAGALVLSDYNKGVLTPVFIQDIIKKAKAAGVPVLVDPKRDDFSIYAGADYVTPNRKELSQAVRGMPVKLDEEVEAAALALIEQSGIGAVIATRSEDGMSVVRNGQAAIHIKTRAREVYDVSGAGDTVIAVLAAALGAGADIKEAAALANKAGGIVVGKLGTAAISADELAHDDDHKNSAQVMGWNEARAQIDEWKAQGFRVGFTNGCFDILHYGHVNYLSEAAGKCDRLVIGLNSDASVKILKGPERPVNDETARASVIGALASTDMVVLFGATEARQDNTPCDLIAHLRPDVFFKGGDYTIDQLPEAKIVQAYGGSVEIMPMYEGYSTTAIIEKSKSADAA